MLVLWEHGEITVKDLGQRLRLDSGTLSPLLKRLDAAGLVRRERSQEDERSVLVAPTADGEALRERASALPAQAVSATGMSLRELRDLKQRLRQLTEALDAAT
jgi:MarR family transcriptional regulator, organic hydroperoxide resistance regulator